MSDAAARRMLNLAPEPPQMNPNRERLNPYGRTIEEVREATRRSNVDALRAAQQAARRARRNQLLRTAGRRHGPYSQQRMSRRRGTRAQRPPRQPSAPEIVTEEVPVAVAVAEEQNLYKQLLNLNEEQRDSQYNALIEDDKSKIRRLCNNLTPIALQAIDNGNGNPPLAQAILLDIPANQLGGRRKRQRKKRTKKKSRRRKRKTLKKKRKRRRKTRR